MFQAQTKLITTEAFMAFTLLLENGSKVVWLVDTQRQKVELYTVDDTEILESNDMLDGGELLPDFKLLVSSLWTLA